jgi:hypothetical protein
MKRRVVHPEAAWLQWSFSKLNALLTCPLQFWFGYIEKPAIPKPVILAVGSALHFLARRFYTPHPSTKRYPYDSAKKLGAAWRGLLSGVISGKHGPDGFKSRRNPPVPIAWRNEGEQRYWMGRGTEILEKFFENNAHRRGTGVGILREHRLRFGWMGFTILAVLDRVDDVGGAVSIADYKMGNYEWWELEDDIQPTVYQLGYRECLQARRFNGRPLSGMRIEALSVHGRINEVPLREAIHFRRLHDLLLQASAYVETILTGRTRHLEFLKKSNVFRASDAEERVFFPRLPRGDHCRYCNYVRECKEWERKWEESLAAASSIRNSAAVWREMIAAARREQLPGQLELPFVA